MKYIKTYEECNDAEKLIYDDCRDSWYWKVSAKYADIIFDKLGVDKNWFGGLWEEDFYLFKTKHNNGEIGWTYAGLNFKNPSYRKPPKYMGEVEITEEDIKRWEMKDDTEKYNL